MRKGSILLPTFLKGPGWQDDTATADLKPSSVLKARREKSTLRSFPNLSKSRSTGALRSSIQLAKKAFKTVVVGTPRVAMPTLFTDLMNMEAVATTRGMETSRRGTKFARGRGCKVCNMSGFKGRTGIYELLKVSPAIQKAALKKASADDIRDLAIKEGMRTLRDSAIEKLLAGLTTLEEVMRVTMEAQG